MTRVGMLHCHGCGMDIPVGADAEARDYGRLVAQADVRCVDCSVKAAARLTEMEARYVPPEWFHNGGHWLHRANRRGWYATLATPFGYPQEDDEDRTWVVSLLVGPDGGAHYRGEGRTAREALADAEAAAKGGVA